ncbi:23S rRNA (guanosine(2251)-2'-O)-methyltransferase RlmB [Columbia Basin potato purple top phytoplasma]|uniref:23S rRNA (Guanosine(2251)-2'-O)-methyltransferase RlmB n=1 Tax=Columbia Basin potato purple top phytoplasma TaxID=307134 RepID=A0ABT5L8Q4_9MOLU|nr:23S rRNA (guanosine(2251)-2'-O)-methyltransferase RlmB [Columbia Basin potato purple top phytoplasma]MDC9032024.1 23S rRNA (guanosine(2251)-2'-O)-methyltransferase RlmB [Columbia Basin potato purple top phytoplasma]
MIVYGKNVIKEVVINKRPIYELYINSKMQDRFFLNFLNQNNIEYKFLDKHQLNEKSKSFDHQGVVAKVKDYKYQDLSSFLKSHSLNSNKFQKLLILDEIHDPHNFGAILRTMETMKFDGVIVSKKHQVLLNGTVAKASSGALEYVNIFLANNLHKTIIDLQKENIIVIGTDPTSCLTMEEVDTNRSLAVILGNEGKGIRPLLKNKCDFLFQIPMHGRINSLNVSVAAALIMYKFQNKT